GGGAQTCRRQCIAAPFIAKQISPAAGAGGSTIATAAQANRAGPRDQSDSPTLGCAGGQQGQGVVFDADRFGELPFPGPVQYRRTVLFAIGSGQCQTSRCERPWCDIGPHAGGGNGGFDVP